MIAYVTIGADNIAFAKRFYAAFLPALGYGLEEGSEGLSFALPVAHGERPVSPDFYVKPTYNGQPATAGNGTMVAFEALNQKQVRNRDWMQTGDILRLDSSDPAVIAEQQQARDGSRFVVFAGKAATSAQISPRPLRLTALDPAATYRITLANRDTAPRLSRGNPALKSAALDLSGAYLMRHGITLPWSFPERMWVIEGTLL